MKNIWSKSLLFLLSATVAAPLAAQQLLPQPEHVAWAPGSFRLDRPCRFEAATPAAAGARQWVAFLERPAWQTAAATPRRLLLTPMAPAASPEAYRLRITPDTIELSAAAPVGFLQGSRTLRQLVAGDSLPCCTVTDAPAFAWRGLMLDVSRHFFPVSFLKKQIDVIASYKLNRLHLHLTDAAGWRMEIKRYPELTRTAAWRTDSLWKTWWNGDRRYVAEDTPGAYGGYYTQDELRDLVDYAGQRGITIIPEIEMPGHSEEVLAVYPELSCTHEPYKQADFCPGNEATFRFLENVLDEVMAVFPSQDIHIGGDEAAKQSWPDCPLCRKRMAAEGLTDVNGLQAYFVRRIGAYLAKHGRRLVGWDEIIADSLPGGATVMLWRDTAYVHDAIRCGYDVVLSPGRYCYLDAYQDAPPSEPEAIGGFRPLSHVYSYNPLAHLSTAERQRIRGVQGNLWTEYIATPAHVEHMLYPRLLALAEIAWRGGPATDFTDFRRRALAETQRLRASGVNAFDLSREKGDRAEALRPVRHKALGAKVTYRYPFNETYRATGETALTDGCRGGWDYAAPSAWQGFISGKRFDVVLDLGQPMPVESVQTHFFQATGVEIFYPARFVVSVSVDGEHYETLTDVRQPVEKLAKPAITTMGWKGQATPARYVRVQAEPGDYGGWIFVDEVEVY